ncbi:MAG: hypothetical protein IPL61_25400 [Myxococcales bacterium]|nr:hypothetical protein [Myxococcales bacterium]
MRVRAVLVSITALAGLAGGAAADAPVAFHVVDAGGHRRIVIDTPVEITGRAPAPAVAVLTAPPRIDYQWPADLDSFLPRILAGLAQVRP